MQLSGDESGAGNAHAAWRMAVARRGRARADAFPGWLVAALVEQALAPEVLRGWAAREALVSRGDGLAGSDLLTRAGHAVVRVVLALNRVYLPHRQLKWQRHLITGLGVAPERLAERLGSMQRASMKKRSRRPKPCWQRS